jgi:hypothetical protein
LSYKAFEGPLEAFIRSLKGLSPKALSGFDKPSLIKPFEGRPYEVLKGRQLIRPI